MNDRIPTGELDKAMPDGVEQHDEDVSTHDLQPYVEMIVRATISDEENALTGGLEPAEEEAVLGQDRP